MNPIVAVALQLLQQKQQEEELSQRKQEAVERLKLDEEQLKQVSERFKIENATRQKQFELDKFKVEDALRSKYREDIASGARKPQGLPSSSATYQPGNLPVQKDTSNLPPELVSRFPVLAQPVEYDLQQQDIQPGPISPYAVQQLQGPFGQLSVEDVVTYPEMREQKLNEAQQALSIKGLESLITTKAQEEAKRPNIEAQIAGRENVAQIAADQRAATAATNRESAERIAGSRNAVTLEAARIRSTGNKVSGSDEMLSNIADSVILGETKLPAGNNGIAIHNSIKSMGYVIPDQALVKKVPYAGTMLNIAKRIEDDIIPKLATNPTGAKWTGIITNIWPTDLAALIKTMGIDATTAAREAGEKGNFSNTDIGRAFDALTSPGITQEQAKKRLLDLRDKVYDKLIRENLGGLPEKQKLLLLQKYELDPTSIQIKVNGNRLKKYKRDTEGNFYVYSSKTNDYEEVQ